MERRELIRSLVTAFTPMNATRRRDLAIRATRHALEPFRSWASREQMTALEQVLAAAKRVAAGELAEAALAAVRTVATKLERAAWDAQRHAKDGELCVMGFAYVARAAGAAATPEGGTIAPSQWRDGADEPFGGDVVAPVVIASSSAALAAGYLAQFLAVKAQNFKVSYFDTAGAFCDAEQAELAWQLASLSRP